MYAFNIKLTLSFLYYSQNLFKCCYKQIGFWINWKSWNVVFTHWFSKSIWFWIGSGVLESILMGLSPEVLPLPSPSLKVTKMFAKSVLYMSSREEMHNITAILWLNPNRLFSNKVLFLKVCFAMLPKYLHTGVSTLSGRAVFEAISGTDGIPEWGYVLGRWRVIWFDWLFYASVTIILRCELVKSHM